VESVRAELAAIDPPRTCCREAERAGLAEAALGRARSPVVARLAVRLSDGGGPADGPVAVDWDGLRGHCRAAWLRGRVLSSGSLSLAGGTHLEFVVPLEEASALRDRLAAMGLRATWRERRGRGVVTSKDTEAILAFLRTCGASASVLEVEARQVARQLQGHLNRVLNAETANLRRSVESSVRQIETIDRLAASGRLRELPAVERSVAQERIDAPEASLSELATRLRLSRARVQRAFEHLESASDAGRERDR
jgi:DNA-binding protein WhiA